MKRSFIFLFFLSISLFVLLSCNSNRNSNEEEKEFLIPEESIKYSGLSFGNVIQDGKQSVLLGFVSDYRVTKIEYAGNLLDYSGTTIYSFDSSVLFGSPSKEPHISVRVDSGLLKYIRSASFTKIVAYTDEKVNDNDVNASSSISPKYTVSFSTNGGSNISPIQCSELLTEPVTARNGFLFDGWYLNSNYKTPALFPFKLESDTTLYAKWIRLEGIMYCKDSSIKFLDDVKNSHIIFKITPVDFDFLELSSKGYKIRIDVEYDCYYKKDYDVPFDIGYMGSPKYEVSIYNSDSIGQFKNDLSTKSTSQTRTISYSDHAVNYNNTIIYLEFSTDNIQNIIYFKNIVVKYTAYK